MSLDATYRTQNNRNEVKQKDDLDFCIVHELDDLETCMVASASHSLPDIKAITWKRFRDKTSCDIYLLQLIDMAEHGSPHCQQLMPPQLFALLALLQRLVSCKWRTYLWFKGSYTSQNFKVRSSPTYIGLTKLLANRQQCVLARHHFRHLDPVSARCLLQLPLVPEHHFKQ